MKKKYTPEFKRQAVLMMTQQGLSVRDSGEAAFPLPGQPTTQEQEILRLKAENKRLQAERDILKKASAFFATQMQ